MALFGTNQIGRVDPANGDLRIFSLPTPGSRPRRLIVDAKGIVWYSDYARDRLGRLDPATGQVREVPCPRGRGSQPDGIAIGSGGGGWDGGARKNGNGAFGPPPRRTQTAGVPPRGGGGR